MKATISVADKKEAELIRLGLEEPATRALVKVIGALAPLPTKEKKARVLKFVSEILMEPSE
jgi:hypothetical protein